MAKFCITLFVVIAFALAADAQSKSPYIYPEEQEVNQTLEKWRDLKFGLFIHWGTYSQWGIVESWSLLPEHTELCYKPRPDSLSYFEYVQAYENLKTTFNPTLFNPEKWADAAKYAGMKYMVFTTKHHDGFNMFDTHLSDYKITDSACPFHSNEKANISKAVFEAFRAKGFMNGAYYSIPDWHSNDYWWDKFPPMGKGINYPAAKFPEKLDAFHNYVNGQLDELTNGTYGQLDIMWFDLCYAEPTMPWGLLAQTIRNNQPGALMVQRHSNTIYENYRTPEQTVPAQALDYPWESCITMGTSWSYKPNDVYKPTKKILEILVKIVSRGGSLLLNVGPDANGELPDDVYSRLEEIGDWMSVNSEAIYGTETFAPYFERNYYFTKRENNIYAFYIPSSDQSSLPKVVSIDSIKPVKGTKVSLLGYDKPLKWEPNGDGIVIYIPKSLQQNLPCRYIWCLKFEI